MKVTVLFFHHAADELTRHHHAQLCERNAADAGCEVVPMGFPEHLGECLPGTYVPGHLEALRWNRQPALRRFGKPGLPVLSDLDCLVWDYVLFSGKRSERIVLAEGDMMSRCSMREFFGPSFCHEVSGSMVRRGVQGNERWWWYRQVPAARREELGNLVASVTPVCGIQMSWAAAERMARLVYRSGGLFDDLHVELAVGTLARMTGVEPMETEVPRGTRPVDYINCRAETLKLDGWGIFHPVKEVLGEEEPGGEPQGEEWSVLEDDCRWIVDYCRREGVRRVVEFGPGRSTLAFLQAGCEVLTAENDPERLEEARRTFEKAAGVRVCGYRDEPGCGMEEPETPPDLVFVDGPVAWNGGSRRHTLEWACRHGRRVLLHDARRPGERQLLRELPAGEWSCRLIPTRKGLALLERKDACTGDGA